MEEQLPTIAFGSEALKLKIGTSSFSCFILANGQRILAKNSVQKAMGYDGKSENWLFEFIMNINRLIPVEPVILEALGRDITFKNDSGHIKHGISPNLFIEVCRVITKANADGFLYVSELKFAKSAENFLNNIGDADIEILIDHATGYSLFKHNHKEALIRTMLFSNDHQYPVWIRSFSDNFMSTIFNFNDWHWKDLNSKAQTIGAYLNDVIFSRIDEPLFELLNTTKPKMKYRKGNNAEQYLENPELKAYLTSIMALIRASDKSDIIFRQLIDKSFPKKRTLDVSSSGKNNAGDQTGVKLSLFNENLQRALQLKKK